MNPHYVPAVHFRAGSETSPRPLCGATSFRSLFGRYVEGLRTAWDKRRIGEFRLSPRQEDVSCRRCWKLLGLQVPTP